MGGRTSTSAGELARKGFNDASRAAEILAKLPFPSGDLVDELTKAADPDQALVGLASLIESDIDEVKKALENPSWQRRMIDVLGFSLALSHHLSAHIDDLAVLEPVPRRWSASEIRADLLADIGLDIDPDDFEALAMAVADKPDASDALRLANKRHLVRIAGRDLSSDEPQAIVNHIAGELSDLADAIMVCALAIARAQVAGQAKARIGIVALGKCGAQELNYLSDIDVLFVGEPSHDDVEPQEAIAVANQLAATLTRICSAHSQAGTIWQVDAALRPEGNAGPLVRTLEGHQAYYERWAKNWEFQAMLKARPMAGDMRLGKGFCDIVEPLVWQAGGRENFMTDMQAMRRRVIKLIPACDVDDEIKLGAGGLRDVEFSVQMLQLVHGRADERLRHRGTLVSLEALAAYGYINRVDALQLDEDYRFERCVEHRIQLYKLRRNHVMPKNDADRRRIARSLGISGGVGVPDADELWKTWRKIARNVQRRQNQVFYSPLLLSVSKLSEDELHLSSEAAMDRLRALGFSDPRSALRHIEALTTGSSRSVEIQRQLMPAMLGWLATGPNPDLGLVSFRRISEAMGGTSWYLRALRDEGRMAELLAIALSSSRYAIAMLEHDPSAVQLLAKPEELAPRSRESLEQSMSAAARRHDEPIEAMNAVRVIRRRELLRLAFGDGLGRIGLDAVSVGLSDLVGATIQAALSIAVRQETTDVPPIGIVAMGRWGGDELSYASDADAMFVVPDEASPEARATAIRVIATMRSLLHLPGADQPLDVDADLRPEGKDGPMVRTLSSYLAYYEKWSATWEHQALIRAAYGAGDRELVDQLLAGIDKYRWPKEGLGANEITEIRRLKARMETERIQRGTNPRRNLKLGPGGLSDVEWTVQLLQLQYGGAFPALRTPSTMKALAACEQENLLDSADADILRESWQKASRLRNHTMLVRGKTSDQLPSDARDLAAIALRLGRGAEAASLLVEDYEHTARLASKVVDRIFWGHNE